MLHTSVFTVHSTPRHFSEQILSNLLWVRYLKLTFFTTHCTVQTQFTQYSYSFVHRSATINQFARYLQCSASSDWLDTIFPQLCYKVYTFSLGSVTRYTTSSIIMRKIYKTPFFNVGISGVVYLVTEPSKNYVKLVTCN